MGAPTIPCLVDQEGKLNTSGLGAQGIPIAALRLSAI